MKFYQVSREIEAAPEAVWEVLTDLEGWTRWDSAVASAEGEIAEGNTVKVTPEGSARGFPAKVAELHPPRRMVWQGGMPLGLFRGVRTFELTPHGGATRFRMREEFSGLLLPLIWKSMPDLQPNFERFADGLAKRAESR